MYAHFMSAAPNVNPKHVSMDNCKHVRAISAAAQSDITWPLSESLLPRTTMRPVRFKFTSSSFINFNIAWEVILLDSSGRLLYSTSSYDSRQLS